MSNFRIDPSEWKKHKIKKNEISVVPLSVLNGFNSSLLDLGDLSQPSTPINACAAIFDLEGFTNFCRQIDPHLSVPAYLNRFIAWLMDQLKLESISKKFRDSAYLWHPPPFYTKFMGDGLLALWETDEIPEITLLNIIISLKDICERYTEKFVPEVRAFVVDPPGRLRCGVARGTVLSVGDDADYVGSCINMAARVQKLPGVTFAFNRRGFYVEKHPEHQPIQQNFVTKRVPIRGIGDGELICILRHDFEKMDRSDRSLYANA